MRIKLTRGYVRVPDAWQVEDEETVQTKVWHYLFEKKNEGPRTRRGGAGASIKECIQASLQRRWSRHLCSQIDRPE